MSYYILDENKNPVQTDNVIEWAEWFEKADRKVLNTEHKKVRVSTVFLGLDHQYGDGPPLLFETMIFGGEHDEYCERYSTFDESVKGHHVACELAEIKNPKQQQG